MCPDGGKIINRVILEISHDYERQRLCQEVTGLLQVNAGTCSSPPFISVWRKRGGVCVWFLNTDLLFSWEEKFSKRSVRQNLSTLVFRNNWTFFLPMCHSPECFRGSKQEEVVIFMASFVLELTQGWAWETWRVLLCSWLVSWPRPVFAYGRCDNN